MMAILLLSLLLLLGAVNSAAAPFQVEVGLPQRNLVELESLFWAVSDPDSTEYLKHRTREELRELVGATDAERRAANDWLLSLGATRVVEGALGDSVTGHFGIAPSLLLRPRFRHDYVLHRRAGSSASESRRRVASSLRSGSAAAYTIAEQKKAYGIPVDLQASSNVTQMVWGPGSFGYSKAQLELHKATQCPLLNMEKVVFDTENHGTPGGDNFGEGNLDVKMIASFGLNVLTIVSNTNTSSSTEESDGFGAALLEFLTSLAARDTVPHVLSMSLGSLSSYSCELLCAGAVDLGIDADDCRTFVEAQRQVCMYLSPEQDQRISTALQMLGLRGVTVLGSSGDGGSHYSFQPYTGRGADKAIADALNNVSCNNMMPVYPTSSPYLLSVGGTQWKNGDPNDPVAWVGTGASPLSHCRYVPA